VTWRRTNGYSFLTLNRVGVRFLEGEWENDVGVPILETVGKCGLEDRGEENRDGVGEAIWIARTEEGVRKGGLERTFEGVTGVASRGV
jgi:hypothetical protein